MKKKILIIILSLLQVYLSFSQNNFYFKRTNINADEIPTSMVQCENNQLFLSTFYGIGVNRIPTILKFRKNQLIDSLQINNINYNKIINTSQNLTLKGTIFDLKMKNSSTFTAWGFILDNSTNKYNLSYWLIDTNLQVLDNKNYLTNFNEQNYIVCNPLKNGKFFISLTGIGSKWFGLLSAICDNNGNLLDSVYLDFPNIDYGWGIIENNDKFISAVTSNKFATEVGNSACFICYDTLLNLIKIDTIPYTQSGISLIMNIKKKNDKEFYLCGKTVDFIGALPCHRTTITLFDTSYQVLKTLHIGNLTADTISYPGSYKSFDFNNLQNLYVAYTYNLSYISWSTQATWVTLCNLDSNLNIRWKKYIGGDISYRANSILADSVGGCYITGSLYDSTLNMQQRDIFILKFDSLGNTITEVPKNIYLFDEAFVYPNPGIDKLNIIVPENNKFLTFEIYNVLGNLCVSESFSNENYKINTEKLNSGIYFYRIIKNNKTISTGKWIKQ